MHKKFGKKKSNWESPKSKKGSGDKLQKYGYFVLALFVRVPIPGTSVYDGSIATYLFNMERKKAFLANAMGIKISSLFFCGITPSDN